MRAIKFKFVVESEGKKYISGEYVLDEDGLPNAETILEDMEVCDCNLNESVSVCEGDCVQFYDAKVVEAIQCTGLKDKGRPPREMYGEDIIIAHMVKYVIHYHYGSFKCYKDAHYNEYAFELVEAISRGCIVVGNMTENNELLDVNG